MRNFKLSAAVTAAAACIAYPVGAAEIEEIVVTATKRGELAVQEMAESVHVLGADSMALRRQFDFESFAASVPGLQFQDLGPGDKEFIIRGINGNGPSVVGAYFDEYVITANDQQDGGGKNAPIKLVDMARVEVLNGPQGTLYGANSMAGNIRFIPNKPDMEALYVAADLDLSSTSDGGEGYFVNGTLNLPVAQDSLALRVTGYAEDQDGWIDQARRESPGGFSLDEDINDVEVVGGRVSLRWTPADRWMLDLLYLNQAMDVGGSPRFTAKGVPAWPSQPPEIANLPGNPGFAPLPGLPALTPADDFINSDVTRNDREDDVQLFGGTLSYDAGFGTFTGIASYFEHEILFNFDSTPILLFFNAPLVAQTVQPQTYETTTVEGRFSSALDGPFNFVAGAYYQKDDNDFEVRVVTTDGSGNGVAWDPLNANDAFLSGGSAVFGRERNDEVKQKAVFGEATFDFAERWQLLAGLRWFDAEIDSIQGTTHGFFGGLTAPGPDSVVVGTTDNGNPLFLFEQSDDTVRPKVSLSYDVSEDVMLYALYSEGFRVGGVNNGNQPFAQGIPATFDSDELTNIEFGVKSIWLDRRLQLNATLFFIDWDDIQVEPRDPAGNIPFTTNGGAAEVRGLEWSLDALLTESLRWTFTGTYLFTHELSENQPVLPGASPFVIVGTDGDEIPNTPDLQLYTSLQYDATIWQRPASFIADVRYRGSADTEFVASNPFNIGLDSYTMVDVYANLDVTENVTIGIYAKNLFDELAVYDGIGTFQDPESIIAARPLTFGISGRYRF
jgi:outer membrane receptor protein involved in Fe transport